MNRKTWLTDFAKTSGRKELPTYVIGIIKAIAEDRGYTSDQAMEEIQETLCSLSQVRKDDELPWDLTTEEAPALTGAVEKIELLHDSTETWDMEQIMRREG